MNKVKSSSVVLNKASATIAVFNEWLKLIESRKSESVIDGLKSYDFVKIPASQNWHEIAVALSKLVRSPNKPLSVLAAQVVGKLFLNKKIKSKNDCRELIKALLLRTAHTDLVLSSIAFNALEIAAANLPLGRIVSILNKDGVASSNPLIRCTTTQIMLLITQWLGGDEILDMPHGLGLKFVRMTAKLLVDVRQDTRDNCKRIFKLMLDGQKFHEKFGRGSPVVLDKNMQNKYQDLKKIFVELYRNDNV